MQNRPLRNLSEIPKGETAATMYELAMKRKWYYLAATIAQNYGLSTPQINQAAFAAFCRFDDLGRHEEALEVINRFGLSLSNVTSESLTHVGDLLHLMQAVGDLPAGSIIRGPREIQ